MTQAESNFINILKIYETGYNKSCLYVDCRNFSYFSLLSHLAPNVSPWGLKLKMDVELEQNLSCLKNLFLIKKKKEKSVFAIVEHIVYVNRINNNED